MNKIFNDVSVAGILAPGQLYVLSEAPRDSLYPEPIEELFIIKNETEILIALDRIFGQMFADEYELVEFLGIRKVSDDCHEFKILGCLKKSEKNIMLSRYLNRVRSFEEFESEIERYYGDED